MQSDIPVENVLAILEAFPIMVRKATLLP